MLQRYQSRRACPEAAEGGTQKLAQRASTGETLKTRSEAPEGRNGFKPSPETHIRSSEIQERTPMNPKVNILMVDDQPAKLLSYEVILSELGENLIKATSGREALEYLLKTDVAVVLMDVSMPELNGFELADMIRQHPRFQKTAIIFISAVHLTDLDRLKGYERGAVDYISVPVIPELLRAKVSVFAELHRKARQLETLNRQLEERVLQRTAEIRELNSELQQRVAAAETTTQVLRTGVAVAHAPEFRFITGNADLSDLLGMKQGDNLLKSGDGELPYDIYQNGQKLQPGEFPVQRAAANRELVGTVE